VRLDIDFIRTQARLGQFILTSHAHEERQEEAIEVQDIKEALSNGKVLEDYPDDPRGHSCLVPGYAKGRPIHVLCGRDKAGGLLLITVYIPMPPRWINPETRRKK